MNPHRSILFVAMLMSISLWSVPATRALAEPVAVVAAVKGQVDVMPARARRSVRAAFGRALERGDKVSVAPGATATLFFNDGNVIELSERSTITIGGRAAAAAKGGAIPGEVFARVTQFATGGSRQTGLVAMAEMRSGDETALPLLLSPRRTALRTDRPAFRWRAVRGATRYRVQVMGAGPGALWTHELAATDGDASLMLAYPADAKPLPAGTELRWELEALDAKGALRKEIGTMRVLSADARTEVEADLARIAESAGGEETAAARFLAGSYLRGWDLRDEAVAQFEALARLAPDAPAPRETLGDLYLSMGLADLAAAEFQQALALQRAAP